MWKELQRIRTYLCSGNNLELKFLKVSKAYDPSPNDVFYCFTSASVFMKIKYFMSMCMVWSIYFTLMKLIIQIQCRYQRWGNKNLVEIEVE